LEITDKYFHFAKKDETLNMALNRLSEIYDKVKVTAEFRI